MSVQTPCPNEASLIAMIDCELDDAHDREVADHVNKCKTCQQCLETLVTRDLREDLEFDRLSSGFCKEVDETDFTLSDDLIGKLTATLVSSTTHPSFSLAFDFLTPSDDPASLGRLGQYEITELIGRGGMGIVLKGRDTKLERVVAVKVLAPELAAHPNARRRFLREAKAAASISDDHLVTVHAVESCELPYLVMECIDGCSLQQKLDRDGPLEAKEILRVGMQTAKGLAAAHAQGLIHHDIKPANILLQNSVERAKVVDFGLARAVDDATITRTGEVRGTPQYMSPEQARGEKTDPRSDLFSLGAVLYAMCTGRAPFRAECTMGVLNRVCHDTPRPILEVNPDIPDWLVSIVARLMEKDPDDRFQSADEVAKVLSRCLAHLQQPTDVALPSLPTTRPAAANGRARLVVGQGSRWYVGLIAGAVMIGVLGLSEAAGVTNLSATVIRLAVGEGTIVIEVDDPTIEISLDGEALTITGSGLQELKLRPGQYRFQATKDGRPIEQKLVSISRGDREVVRVTHEQGGRTLGGVGNLTESNAFVVINVDGTEVNRYDRLGQAVEMASEHDVIEIRGNGPFRINQLNISQPLTIRASEGFLPVLVANIDPFNGRSASLIVQRAPLVLEGLRLRCLLVADEITPENVGVCIQSRASLRIANCTFQMEKPYGVVGSASDLWIVNSCLAVCLLA